MAKWLFTPAGLVGLWLVGANALAFALMGLDKGRARAGGRRVAELTFFSLALLATFVTFALVLAGVI